MRAAVFLDRDGVLVRARVINGKPFPPVRAQEMEIEPGAREALRRLAERGFVLVVVTNQPDVARGELSADALDEMHHRLMNELPVEGIWTCPHDDGDACACRKPKPGLILEAAQALGIDLARSFMVGDRWRDVEAAHAAGCTAIWLDRGYDERSPAVQPDARVRSLGEAVDWILSRTLTRAEDDDKPL